MDVLRDLLADVMMVGVAMGMTSEEPITHLERFTDLLSQEDGSVWVRLVTAPVEHKHSRTYYLEQPNLTEAISSELLSAAASFLGWQLVMALYGYLQDIHFAGQPAVFEDVARDVEEG